MRTWVAVKGYEGLYEVSDRGRVRSLDRWAENRGSKTRMFLKGKLLSPRSNRGYPHVSLSKGGKVRPFGVHVLVAIAFLPPPNPGQDQVNHKDGDPTNNCWDNLEWATSQENHDHAVRLGLHQKKLTRSDTHTICKRLADGDKGVDIAKDYKVSDVAISKIKRRYLPGWQLFQQFA